MNHQTIESLTRELCDFSAREAYRRPYDNYRVRIVPRILGGFLIFLGNVVYGEAPTYLKFRAIEVIARVPYHSWQTAAYTLLTYGYTNEKRAIALSNISQFSRLAQDNETMHVVVISQFAKKEARANVILHTLIPLLFAFFYFWALYILYLLKPRYALELNYMFEQHAFDQYGEFLARECEELKNKSAESDFLTWYGRHVRNQYEFFELVRNDELIHRNRSVREIELHEGN